MKKILLIISLCFLCYLKAHAAPATPLAYTSTANPLVTINVTPTSPLPIAVYDSGNHSGFCFTSNGSASAATFQACGGGSSGVTSITAGAGIVTSPALGITTTGTVSGLLATTTAQGEVIVGSGLAISTTGVLSATASGVSVTAGSSNIVITPSPLTGTGTIDLASTISITNLALSGTATIPTLNFTNALGSTITATTFNGALSGNATTATTATNATNSAVTFTNSNTNYDFLGVTTTTGNLPIFTSSALTWNPSTGQINATVGKFSGWVGVGGGSGASGPNIQSSNGSNFKACSTFTCAITIDGSTGIVTISQNLISTSGEQWVKRNIADAIATVGSGDKILAYTSLSTSRVVSITCTLGTATSAQIFMVKDESGSAGVTNTLVLTPISGTIDGASTKSISSAFGVIRYYSNGTNCFTW